jgi:hypothetical protein
VVTVHRISREASDSGVRDAVCRKNPF